MFSASAAFSAPFSFVQQPDTLDVVKDGAVWLRTMTPVFDAAKADETYKVYTHVFDFAGKQPITKGPGGKYTHHRGLFIGWKDTMVNGVDYDTWHMPNCTQRHMSWESTQADDAKAVQRERVDWCDDKGAPFIGEVRTISAHAGDNGLRIIDFESELTSHAGRIELKGDLQHAGMQVRMANEVSEHEATTQYVMPDGAKELEDDKVVGAWWMMCSPEVGGKRYYVMHMTHPSLVTGEPVYSIRRYARFGAFFEPTLEEGKPALFRFRVIVSEKELDRAQCVSLYADYSK